MDNSAILFSIGETIGIPKEHIKQSNALAFYTTLPTNGQDCRGSHPLQRRGYHPSQSLLLATRFFRVIMINM
jgi:hypothetical protein